MLKYPTKDKLKKHSYKYRNIYEPVHLHINYFFNTLMPKTDKEMNSLIEWKNFHYVISHNDID